jgi:uncharacterized protein YdcH (DUF465 family)
MEQRDEELIVSLLPQVPELRVAYEEHRKLKAEVDSLQSKTKLTAEEELTKKTLQKRKLAQKDKIMRILAEHRRAGSGGPRA